MKMGERPWQDCGTLHRLYVEEQLSQPQIAERLDCGVSTVRKWLKRHGIETRDSVEARYIRFRSSPDVTLTMNRRGYEEIRSQYQGEQDRFYLHRLLAVAEFGIDAVEGMQVHHKSRIPWDNRPENIELMSASEHKTHHLLNDCRPE